MTIEVIDYSDGTNTQASSTVVATNAALQAGDIWGVNIGISNETVTTPSGWSLLGMSIIATTRRVYWFAKEYGASESNVTFSFSATAHHSATPFGLRGAALGVDADLQVGSGTSGTTVTAPTITTATDEAILLCSFHKFVLTSGRTLSLPSGMTSIGTGSANGSQGQCYHVAYEIRPTAGSTGTRASTSNDSANNWGASSIAVAPESADTGQFFPFLGV